MNKAKVKEEDYINFLIGTPKVCSATEAERVQPEGKNKAAHDAFTRLLHRLEPDAEVLWEEGSREVKRKEGIIVIDDSTLDHVYSNKMELVSYHWSGKNHEVVKGINLVTLLWTQGDRHIPCDYRIYEKEGKTKNDHFIDMIEEAKKRGFEPECVVFDSWYSSLANLKQIRNYNWFWLTRIKSNRKVNPNKKGLQQVKEVEIGEEGRIVQLEGYGLVKVFKIVVKDNDIEYWVTNKLEMGELERIKYSSFAWTIETYHRGIKQYCCIERAQVRSGRAQRNHIGLALRAHVTQKNQE